MNRAQTETYQELSVPAVLLGAVTGVLLTASFVYVGLKLGFGLSGSTVAAIVGFSVLRGALKRRSIVENNINQTVASGINTASAGVTFTLPALFLLSVAHPELESPPLFPLLFASVAGSLMGIVLIIPLRKQMIEFERLKFPSGIAVGTLLRSPGEGAAQAKLLAVGAGLGFLLTIGTEQGFLPGEWNLGAWFGAPAWLPVALYVSTANFGAGLLSGKGGLPFAAGGVLAWWVVAPIIATVGAITVPPAVEVAGSAMGLAGDAMLSDVIYGAMLRPLGIGMLIGGAIAGVVAAFPAVKAAVSSLSAAAALAKSGEMTAEEVDPKLLAYGAGGAFVLLYIASYFASDLIGPMHALLIAVVGAIWLALAGVIVAQATGATDISPLSGLSLIAVTLMIFLTGGDITASIILGVAVCVAINQCADMMSDLKTGHLVGARPKDQQLAQLLLCWLGPLVAVGVVYLLWNMPGDGTPGFGPASIACQQQLPSCLAAPQGDALAATVEALVSQDAAVDKYFAGAVLGGALSLVPIGGLAVLVGLAMYLPFSITLAYGVGCLVSMRIEKVKGRAFVGKKLVPLAAGLIVGEALTMLIMTLFKVALQMGGGAS